MGKIEEDIRNQRVKEKYRYNSNRFSEVSKARVIESLKRWVKRVEKNNRLRRDNAILMGKLVQ